MIEENYILQATKKSCNSHDSKHDANNCNYNLDKRTSCYEIQELSLTLQSLLNQLDNQINTLYPSIPNASQNFFRHSSNGSH